MDDALELAMTQLALISLLVTEYDEALHFYFNKLNFELLEDTPLSESNDPRPEGVALGSPPWGAVT